MTSKKIMRSSDVTSSDIFSTEPAVEVEQPSEAPLLSETVEEELEELFGNANIRDLLPIQQVSIGDAQYPLDLLDKMPSLPRHLFYMGDFSLLQGKLVTISLSSLKKSQNPKQQETFASEHAAARKEAKFVASRLAAKGYTVVVESVRPHDLEIVLAALEAGGKVVISTPVNIKHRNNTSLKQLETRILNGDVLVISHTNTDNYGKWNTREADTNHELMAALSKYVYIIRCNAQWQGTWIMAICGRKAGRKVFVLDTGSQLHTQLINQYDCTPLSL